MTDRLLPPGLQIIKAAGMSVCVLTKRGSRALRDLDLINQEDAFANEAKVALGRCARSYCIKEDLARYLE